MFNHADFWFAIDGIIPRCARARSSPADRLDFPEMQSDAYPVNAGYLIPANAAPEWQAGRYCFRSRLAGGLSTLGACSKVLLLNMQRLGPFASPAELQRGSQDPLSCTTQRGAADDKIDQRKGRLTTELGITQAFASRNTRPFCI
jgi:hypothetical protein